MNLPFPSLTPRLIDSKWFNADSPCDDEAELSAMEQLYQNWLSSVGQQYMKRVPLGKTEPEPMEEEAESDEEEGNEESDEEEESHDEDEEELRTSYSPPPAAAPAPPRANLSLEPDSADEMAGALLHTSDPDANAT